MAQLGMISASDELRVRYFSQSLTGSAFGWYTSLPPNSVQTWKQLEERFHEQYHSEASEAGIADLAQVRQKRGETVSEYIQRFRTVRNRCYSVHVSEKEAVELAVVGLSSSIKDVASQADYPSLAHMVQKLSAYEQRHPDVYQDKFKRVVTMVDAGEDEGATGEQEVAVAEWTRAAGPVTCKWVKPPGPPRGFDFDVTKTEQIFDLLLAEKHIKIPEGHKIQMAIENGRLIFNQYAMKVDTHPFPAVNMVEFTHLGGCQPDFSANINMVELGHHSEKGGDEGSCSQSKDTEGAAPCDRLRQDGKRYVTEGEVKNIRYQRPLSDHLLNKYVSRYDQRRRHGDDDERDRLARNDRRHRRHSHDEERQERHAGSKTTRAGIGTAPSSTLLGFGNEPIAYDRQLPRIGLAIARSGGSRKVVLVYAKEGTPDLASKVQRTLDEEGLPQRKEWRPKQRKADDETSAGTNMVLVRPAKCRAPRLHDAPEVDNSKRTNVIKSEIGLVLSTGLDE
ncbi:hypothetical protein QYE76_010434 [Lolium multiflorum]|uniref:Retrotransposon gag domain-containing protein n=1 Tax=Lolium multiflorum TaxID=4521 RepID=A0AAD8X4C3_LOLMU|nr:hypothetical protein QYE76_010434 [Lolium multiflorum]